MAAVGDSGVTAGYARYTYRLRVSPTARSALLSEWDRGRWVWNQCVAESRAAHKAGKKCGPAVLDKLLTGWRSRHEWLRAGGSVPQQQAVRDFAKSRAKALKDIKARLPVRQRAGMPRFKRKVSADLTLNYTRHGFRLKGGGLHLAGGIALTVVWSRDLPAEPSSVRIYRDGLGHWYASFVVPAQVQPLPTTGTVIGIDWGVKETATTTSDDHDLPHPEHGKKGSAKLARYQRMMARRAAKAGTGRIEGLPRREAAGREDVQENCPAAPGHRPQMGQARRDALRSDRCGGLPAEVPRQVHDGAESCGRGDRSDQGRADQHGAQAQPGPPPRAPGPHHQGLRAVRSENQARTSPVRTYVYVHGVRSRFSQGQELRTRHARPGRSRPGWR